MTRLVLLASPLLGPAVWAPVADLLTGEGRSVTVCRSPGAVRTPQDVLDAWLPQLPCDEQLVLVPHSNAGLYAAALAAARDVAAVAFVDAGLPAVAPTTPAASVAFREALAALADDDGILPPWTQWWGSAATGGLFPDGATRAAVEAEQVRLRLTYFDAEVPSPSGWDTRAAYLAFGETYAEERAVAFSRGWPVETLPGGHLHMLVDPAAVAGALSRWTRGWVR